MYKHKYITKKPLHKNQKNQKNKKYNDDDDNDDDNNDDDKNSDLVTCDENHIYFYDNINTKSSILFII